MASRNWEKSPEPIFLQAPPERRYVRSFVFSRRINAPLAQIQPLARALLICCLSLALVRTILTDHSDFVGAVLLWVVAMVLFLCSGVSARVARLYVLLALPTLCSLFFTWTILNTLPGTVLLRVPVYSGQLTLGFALWQLLWLGIVVGYFLWRRAIVSGMLLATLLTILLAWLLPLPAWPLAHFAFLRPFTITLTDLGLWLAITKVIGYAGMVLCTLSLVLTGRDVELIGALRQLHVPQSVIFFLSTVFRAFNLALTDYQTIRQAQLVRGINARPRTFVRQLRDFGNTAIPMVAMMIRRSSEIGDALLARGFQLNQAYADFYEAQPWRWLDWLVLLVSLLLLYFALGPHPTLSSLLVR